MSNISLLVEILKDLLPVARVSSVVAASVVGASVTGASVEGSTGATASRIASPLWTSAEIAEEAVEV